MLSLALAPAPQRLRQLEELGAEVQIVREYFDAVRPGGELARDGIAVATVARAAIDSGSLRRAEVLLREARVESAPERVEIERARLAFAGDRLTEASKALVTQDGRGTRMRFPEHPQAWILFARTHARLQDYASADRAARSYLQRAPRGRDSAIAWQIRTDAALRRNDATAAHAYLKLAKEHRLWHELLRARRLQCQRDPKAELPRLGLALVWMEAEDFERARTILGELMQRAPEFCRGWFHLGEAERRLARPAEAEQAYDRALACDADHAPARANRAGLRLERGALGEARADYEALLAGPAEGDPRFLEAHLQLARILLRQGQREAAELRHEAYRERGGKAPLEAPPTPGAAND